MKFTKDKYIILILGIFLIAVIGVVIFASSNKNNSTSNKLKVLATTTQIADFVKNIALDKVEVSTIFAPNVDPHEYEPTFDDVKKINDADIIFENGVGLERKLDKSIQDSVKQVIVLSKGLTIRQGDSASPNEALGDPHIWFSVSNAKKMVSAIADALDNIDPANKAFYDQNLENYIKQLADLDNYIKTKVAEVPYVQRKLVTNHDALGYYVDEYKLIFVGSVIPSLSTETEPTGAETSDLINKIKLQNVKAIFTESSINPKLASQIASEAHVKIVSNLYGDTLGEVGSPGDTYIKMMRFDTESIIENIK